MKNVKKVLAVLLALTMTAGALSGCVSSYVNTETTPAPTQKPTESAKVFKGDADEDEEISINDATFIQRYDVGIPTPWPINLENADVNYDGEVDIRDATWIQRYDIGIIKAFSPDLS